MTTPTSTSSSQVKEQQVGSDGTADRSETIKALDDQYADLTGRVRLLTNDLREGRQQVRRWNLDERTTAKARSDAAALLDELATDRGLSWSDIARLTGVSVSAVRKWRSGEQPSSDRRRSLARLAAFLDLLDEVGPVGDPASWLSMRLSDGHLVTPADLYLAGRTDDLLEHAAGQLDAHHMLDRWDMDWRENARSDWRVVENADGERVVVRRD
jgi:transcriptional regulator with XRE-family HTH domain